MLTYLQFKNWRSLRDVRISDLKPINVLIGANTSGKTNLLDGLYFLRDAAENGVLEAVFARRGEEDIRTIGQSDSEPIEVEFGYSHPKHKDISYNLTLTQQEGGVQYAELLKSDELEMKSFTSGTVHLINEEGIRVSVEKLESRPALAEYATFADLVIRETFLYVTQRWQLLDENFMPPFTSAEIGSLHVIDRCADNLITMLDFMKTTKPQQFDQMQDDLRWLLSHIEKVDTRQADRETRLLVEEKTHLDREAPTISAGTARIIAMLAAYYALDMRFLEMPGLVVIEEPDMSIHPLLLKHFVELLRTYTEREVPRQFILTTHNPRLLDYFEPEEVRIVRRDEQGHTVVDPVPEHIKDIWLDEYGLGEVWMTRALGDVE